VLTLRLRNAWGEPKDWAVDEDDEAFARRTLGALGDFAVGDPDSKERVLLANDDDGPIGAWNREGARRFANEIGPEQERSLLLQTIRQDLLLAVSAG
jgi:hypothetical protein